LSELNLLFTASVTAPCAHNPGSGIQFHLITGFPYSTASSSKEPSTSIWMLSKTDETSPSFRGDAYLPFTTDFVLNDQMKLFYCNNFYMKSYKYCTYFLKYRGYHYFPKIPIESRTAELPLDQPVHLKFVEKLFN
jgi:hypothetical protein